MNARTSGSARKVLVILLLANLLNFFDRAVPAILVEALRREWALSDLQIGLIATAFTVVFALTSIPLGRIADTRSRKAVIGWGLLLWSAFSALGGFAGGFVSFLVTRLGVGIGEASFTPAATAVIGDLFPPNKRSRAMGIYMLGLPLGLLLAFFTVGSIARVFDSWRAPFFISCLPGVLLAIAVFSMHEPKRGSAEVTPTTDRMEKSFRAVLRTPTLWWIAIAGVACNFASYGTSTFMASLLQRYFSLSLEGAAISTGIIVGVTGLVGLTAGGYIADRLHNHFARGRIVMAGLCFAGAAALTWAALTVDASRAGLFTLLFSLGWLLQHVMYVCLYPALHDIVGPSLRATVMALMIALFNLAGGSLGPILIGVLSDRVAHSAMIAAGAPLMTDAFRAAGLHAAMVLIPVSLLVAAIAVAVAARTFPANSDPIRSVSTNDEFA